MQMLIVFLHANTIRVWWWWHHWIISFYYHTLCKNQPYVLNLWCSVLSCACAHVYTDTTPGINITNVADKVFLQAPIIPFQWIPYAILRGEHIKTPLEHYRNILMKLSDLYKGKRRKIINKSKKHKFPWKLLDIAWHPLLTPFRSTAFFKHLVKAPGFSL